jgi:hypothetical protein
MHTFQRKRHNSQKGSGWSRKRKSSTEGLWRGSRASERTRRLLPSSIFPCLRSLTKVAP